VGSPSRMAEDVLRLLDDPARMAQLAVAGHRHAWEQFRHSATSARYVRLYEAMVAGRAAEAAHQGQAARGAGW
jgi:hypothetical protein